MRERIVWLFGFLSQLYPFQNDIIVLVDDEGYDKRRNVSFNHCCSCVSYPHPVVFDRWESKRISHKRFNNCFQRAIYRSISTEAGNAFRKMGAFNDISHYLLSQLFSIAILSSRPL